MQQGPVLQKSVCWIWTASVKYLSIMTIQLCAGRVVRSSHPCWLKISYCLERGRIFFISGLTQNKFCISNSKFLDYFSTAFYPRREKSTWVGLNSGSLAPQAAALTNRSWLLKNDGPSLPLLGTQIPSLILIAWLCPREDSDKRQKDSLLTLYIWH